MKTVLLCRDGAVGRYLAHSLSDAGLIDAIVSESGRRARGRKLRREWARTPWWRVPLFGLDLAALATYGWLWARTLDRRLRGHPAVSGYPTDVPIAHVDDANEPECVSLLSDLAPDVLVVSGTSILGAQVLEIPAQAALNVHGGIVPEYRNVHSEVWAVLKGDRANVGTSILHLDEGIDSGAVAMMGRVSDAKGLFDLRWRNVELASKLIIEALRRLEAGTLPRDPQDGRRSGFYGTPGVTALLRLAFRRGP